MQMKVRHWNLTTSVRPAKETCHYKLPTKTIERLMESNARYATDKIFCKGVSEKGAHTVHDMGET